MDIVVGAVHINRVGSLGTSLSGGLHDTQAGS